MVWRAAGLWSFREREAGKATCTVVAIHYPHKAGERFLGLIVFALSLFSRIKQLLRTKDALRQEEYEFIIDNMILS